MPRHRSFPDTNSWQPPSSPQSFSASPKQKASSVDCNISQPSKHPNGPVLEGNYNLSVQNAFVDVIKFHSTFGRKIRRIEKQARRTELIARAASNIEDNYIGVEVGGSEIKDTEGKPFAENVDEMDTVLDVEKVLDRCEKLCEDAAFEVLQHGVSKGNLWEMKNEFVRMTERIANFR